MVRQFFIAIPLLFVTIANAQMQVRVPLTQPMFVHCANPKVVNELNLTAAQKGKIENLLQDAGVTFVDGKLRMKMQHGMRPDKVNEDVLTVLNPTQQSRLEEIWIQKEDVYVLTQKKYQERMKLSAEQIQKLTSIFDSVQSDLGEVIMSSMHGGQVVIDEATTAKLAKIKAAGIATAAKTLSSSQQSTLEKWKGKALK